MWLSQERTVNAMKYKLSHAWPVHGGSSVIPGGVIIDDTLVTFLTGVIPPSDSVPLDQATYNWLASVYGSTNVPPVEGGTQSIPQTQRRR
jgi:hypothetical protein